MKKQSSRMKIALTLCALVAVPLLFADEKPAVPTVPASSPTADSVAGDWTVTFQAMGRPVSGKLHLEVNGESVSGTIETAHTGPGKVQDGKWANGKLKTTLVFEHHESIVFEGERKSDGTLSGQYQTEGRTETWHAERSAAKADH